MAAALPMAPTVRTAQIKLGYKFKNALYIWEALQAPGSVVRSAEAQGAGTVRHSLAFKRFPDGNRRLAVLGDTVLKTALVEDWYKGDGNRERISRVVSDVGSNINLVYIGRSNGLDALINKNPSEKDQVVGPVTMAATVEAIIGAVYLDGNMESVTKVMQNLGLMPRLVRRTLVNRSPKPEANAPTLESADSPALFESTAHEHENSEPAPRDSEGRLVGRLGMTPT